MRLAALGIGAPQLSAVLVTHLHSDHITDLADVITTRWVMSFEASPLTIVGPPGTSAVVDALLRSLEPDIGYRIAHHDDLTGPPEVAVVEAIDGVIDLTGAVAVSCAPTEHKPVEPSIAFRFDHSGSSVVAAGDTVPCDSLVRLAEGASALVHTVIRKDIIETIPLQRLLDTLDYHSSPEEAGATAARAGVGTLVLTHCVPAFPPGDPVAEEWRDRAATHFPGRVEIGDDLHRVDVVSPQGDE